MFVANKAGTPTVQTISGLNKSITSLSLAEQFSRCLALTERLPLFSAGRHKTLFVINRSLISNPRASVNSVLTP